MKQPKESFHTLFGFGGGPSIKVRIRWISLIILSFTPPMDDRASADLLESLRSSSASSRSFVVINELMALEFIALYESGYRQ